jgi:hypothetical protein
MFPQFLVEQIASVPQAIRYIRREKPDLVLTDEQTKGKLLQGNVDFYRILELDDSVQPGKIRESIEKADEFEIVKNDMASKLPQIDYAIRTQRHIINNINKINETMRLSRLEWQTQKKH